MAKVGDEDYVSNVERFRPRNITTKNLGLRMGLADHVPLKDIIEKDHSPKGEDAEIDDEDAALKVQIKPRFFEREIVNQFTNTIVCTTQRDINETPIEYYEARLYELSKHHVLELHGKRLNLEPIDLLHHIYKLKEIEHTLDSFDVAELNSGLERLIFSRPSTLEEYKLLCSLCEIFSGLIVKWDILVPENYHYRIRGRTMVVKILDLAEMSKTVISVDTLWMATVMNIRPFSKIIEEAVRQYGFVLTKEFEKLVMFALRLNPIDLRNPGNVVGYLAARVPELRTRKHMQPDYGTEVPVYQELALPTGFFRKCSKLRSNFNVEKLRKMLIDFEMLYRAFEISIVRSLLISSYKEEENSE